MVTKRKRGRPEKRARSLAEPIPIVEIDGTDETKAKLPYDADFMNKLPEQMYEAAASINRAYHRLVGRLMCRASKPEKTILGKLAEDQRTDVILNLRYMTWNRKAYQQGYDMDALTGMICDHHAPSTYDALRDRERGHHVRQLMSALALYTETEIPAYKDNRGVYLTLEARLAQTGDHRA